jgi:hypothetical protein
VYSCSLDFLKYDLTCHLRVQAASERAPLRLGQCAYALLKASEKTNLIGSSMGFYIAYHFEIVLPPATREYSTRPSFLSTRAKLGSTTTTSAADLKAVSPPFRVQRVLSVNPDDEDESSVQLLPLHNKTAMPPLRHSHRTATRRAQATRAWCC